MKHNFPLQPLNQYTDKIICVGGSENNVSTINQNAQQVIGFDH